MNARYAVLIAIAAAAMLTSVAAAGPAATTQRVQIDMKIHPGKTFVLAPLAAGAPARDSGTHGCSGEPEISDASLRDGQEVFPWVCQAWVFTGKRGKLVLRSQFVWIEAGQISSGEDPYNIATGTWKVVRGTGQYAAVTGGGRSAQVGTPGSRGMWLARYQGYLTSP